MTAVVEHTDLSGIDLDAEIPCEGVWANETECPHGNPASVIVRSDVWPTDFGLCDTCLAAGTERAAPTGWRIIRRLR